MIKGVESLRPERELCAFRDMETPIKTKVYVEIARAGEDSGSRVTEGILRRSNEVIHIEPTVEVSLACRQRALTNSVGTLRSSAGGIGDVGGFIYGEASSTVCAPDPINVPATKDVGHHSVIEETLLRAERQSVYVIHRQNMFVVIRRRPPIASDALIVLIVTVAAAVGIARVGKKRRVRIGDSKGQIARVALFQMRLKRLVLGAAHPVT